MGTCEEGEPTPGEPCDDGDTCTVRDSCNGDGGCESGPSIFEEPLAEPDQSLACFMELAE